jgi:hypothetical protein
MAERRPLLEGLKEKADINRLVEDQFVYGSKAKAISTPPMPVVMAPPRVPFTTRLRSDMAQAIKRASLERQLNGYAPNTVQEILESALEPWLRENGYLQ